MLTEDVYSLIVIASFGLAAFVWKKYKAYTATEEYQGETL